MEMRVTSRVLVHAVMLVLLTAFGVKVTQCVLEFTDGKVARSTKDFFDQFVKFPTVGVCVGTGDAESLVGFGDMGARGAIQ